jgi:hypothetical protein
VEYISSSANYVKNTYFYVDGGYTNYTQGASVIFSIPEDSFQCFKCEIPKGISRVTVESTAFYNTVGYSQASSLIIPVTPYGTSACSRSELILNPEIVSSTTGVHAEYSGAITVQWPADKEVAYILINTINAEEAPIVTYYNVIGQDGDIYVKYEE